MKAMRVVKSVIIAMPLILHQLACCGADICSSGQKAEKDKTFCPQNLMVTSEGSLSCVERTCSELSFKTCELSGGNTMNHSLISFTPEMCLTDDLSQRNVGFRFNWTLPAGQAEVTGLNIVVEHRDNPLKEIRLNVNLTGHVNSDAEKTFSTDCLAAESVSSGRRYYLSVQVLPSEDRYYFSEPFSYTADCSSPHPSIQALCPAAPRRRPAAEAFCNKTMAVTVDTGFPPGVTSDTTEYSVRVLLCPKPRGPCKMRKKTMQVALAVTEVPMVYFEDLEHGVYQAKSGFLDESGYMICNNNFYLQEGNKTINGPPDIRLQSTTFCNKTIEVFIYVNSYERTSDHKFRVKVILTDFGGNNNREISQELFLYANPKMADYNVTKVFFSRDIQPGNYTITTRFVDDYYEDCSSNKTSEVTVRGPPDMDLHVDSSCKTVTVTLSNHQLDVNVVLAGVNNNLALTKQVNSSDSSDGTTTVDFEDLHPGRYTVTVNFLDPFYKPCSGDSNEEVVIKGSPNISLESRSFCNGSVEVTIHASFFEYTTDDSFEIEVTLSRMGEKEGVMKRTSIARNSSNSTAGIRTVNFPGVQSGIYNIKTKFADEYYEPCSSEKDDEVTVEDCDSLHIPGKFWDQYGKLILGSGILAIVFAVVMTLVHQRWLKKKKYAEQRALTEDHGSSSDQLSSTADTTFQERHMHRYLNDTEKAWTTQLNGHTELNYYHQPMSDDSGLPCDEYDSQSFQENESIAFSV